MGGERESGGRQVPNVTTKCGDKKSTKTSSALALPGKREGPLPSTQPLTCMCVRVHGPQHPPVHTCSDTMAQRPGSPLCTANKGTVIIGRGSRADKRIQNFNICCHKGIRRSETQSISLVSVGREPISKSSGGQRGQERKRKGGEKERERNYRVP